MNDNELIYLIQYHQDGAALELLINKYNNLMWKYIRLYRVKEENIEDFLQEGKIIIYRCAINYDESFNKTFTRYFELSLKRRYWNLINKLPNYLLVDNIELLENKEDFSLTYEENYSLNEKEEVNILEDIINSLKKEEYKIIFNLYFIDKKDINEIVNITKMNIKKIYNIIYRIRLIVKKQYLDN